MVILKKVNIWDIASFSLIFAIFILLVYNWGMFPKFVDVYYHFSVAKGFELANGIVIHDFWEYAPLGRPHLYPPFFHILILLLGKMGFKTEFLLKAISTLIFPLLLSVSWIIFRNLFTKKAAFYIVLLLSSSYSFFWFQTNMIPASLVITLSLIVYYLIERGKFLGASILLALSLYTHLGISSIVVVSLIIYSVLRKEKINVITKVIIISLILFLPWLVHIILNLQFLSIGNQANFIEWKFHLIIFAFALGGFLQCIKLKREMFIPVSYALAMVPFLFFYPSIYFSGHNLFSWSMLGGVFLSSIDKFSFLKNKNYLIAIALIIVLLITPVFILPKEPNYKISLKFEKGTISNLIFYKPKFEDLNLLNKNNLELAEYIKENTESSDLFYIQNAYIGGLITTFTGRSQVGAMYHEVKPVEVPSKRNVYIWINEINDPKPPKDFELVKEINGYKIYKKDNEEYKRKIPSFKVPLIYIYIILITIALLLYFELKR